MGKDHAELGQPPHQGLGVVGRHVDPVVADQVLEGGPHAGVVEHRLAEVHHLDRTGLGRQGGEGQAAER